MGMSTFTTQLLKNQSCKHHHCHFKQYHNKQAPETAGCARGDRGDRRHRGHRGNRGKRGHRRHRGHRGNRGHKGRADRADWAKGQQF